MAFTIGSGTFTNGSATVTGVTLTSGTLAYFASGTRMVVGVNPVIQEVEAIAAPTVTTITLRSAWTGTGGTYSFLANQTSEGLRDAVQAIRTNNASLQSFIDSIDTAATANSVAQRDASGQLTATNLITADKIIHDGDTNTAIRFPAADTVTVETNGAERLRVGSSGNVGIGTSSPATKLDVSGSIRASTGILFGSDTAAANTLDDYEEGTWTPSLGGTATYTRQDGKYTKVGNLVHLTGGMTINSIGVGTGEPRKISGLPFTAAGVSGNTYAGSVAFFSGATSNIISIFLRTNPTTSVIDIGTLSSSGSSPSASTFFGNGTRIDFSMTYFAS